MMSYVAMATAQFDQMIQFYGSLGFRKVRGWDRPNGRGLVLELQGLHLEILDATREKFPMRLEPPGDRFHVVLEVADVEQTRKSLKLVTPDPVTTSWGARLLKFRDPDGVRVWFLQWLEEPQFETPEN
jgi:catechol 2,3-dioxygenase-like lactoylglutathione lyase family enzyme